MTLTEGRNGLNLLLGLELSLAVVIMPSCEDEGDTSSSDSGFWGSADPPGDREYNDTDFLGDLYDDDDD